MTSSLTLVVCVIALAASFLPGDEARPQLPSIPRELQNINFEQYLRNERAMRFQLKCVLYNGPCDTIGKYIKRYLPIYLRTYCKNCDDSQKQLASKFILFIQANYPKEYDDAISKYGKTYYSDAEIAEAEKELGIKIIRDKNAPTRAPGAKPDIDGLVALVKEGINAAVNTKAPIVLGKLGENKTITVTGITLPQQLHKYTTPVTTPVPTSSTTTSSTTTSSTTEKSEDKKEADKKEETDKKEEDPTTEKVVAVTTTKAEDS